jgi:uncharacterized protein
MSKRTIVVGWVILVLLTGATHAAAAEDEQGFLGIITGDVKSTAHHVGMDLKALVKRYNIHLAVYNSSGSVENVYAVYQRPGTHMGLVQSDVLAFVAKVKTDPVLKLIADKIKWVFPLYDQEIHILAKGAILRFSDLQGKRVAIGNAESGAYLTSRLLFEISGVLPRQMLAIGQAQALAALKSGSIDAMITVDGSPVERLALDVSPADDLHLVPVTDDRIRVFYPACRIPSGTYPWQTVEVDTVSVKAILVAYDFRNHHCHTIGNVARLMTDKQEWLRFNGHPKWKTVDLTDTVKAWERYKCVTNFTPTATAAETESSPSRKPNPVADAIEAVFRP